MGCIPDYGWLPTMFVAAYLVFGFFFASYGGKIRKIGIFGQVMITIIWPVFMIAGLVSLWRAHGKANKV